MPTISGRFRLNGAPIVGATVYAYAISRFTTAPSENSAAPVTSDLGPTTTGSNGEWSFGSASDLHYWVACTYTDPNGQSRITWQTAYPVTVGGSSGTLCIAEGAWTAPTLPACGDSTSGFYWAGTSGYRRFGLVGGLDLVWPDAVGPYGSDVNDSLAFTIATHRTSGSPFYASLFSMGLTLSHSEEWNISFSTTSLDADTNIKFDVKTLFINTPELVIPAGSGAMSTPSHSSHTSSGTAGVWLRYNKTANTLEAYVPGVGIKSSGTFT